MDDDPQGPRSTDAGECRVVIAGGGDNCVRLLPPLTLTLDEALAGRSVAGPIWPAFVDSVARYKIPHQYFHEHAQNMHIDLLLYRS